MSVAFLLTSFVIVASPGTGAIFSLGAGLARGPRAAVLHQVIVSGVTLNLLTRLRMTFAACFLVLSGRLALESR